MEKALASASDPVVEAVIPLASADPELEPAIRRLCEGLAAEVGSGALITLADISNEGPTWAMAERLAGELKSVRAIRLPDHTQATALRTLWVRTRARIFAPIEWNVRPNLGALHDMVGLLRPGEARRYRLAPVTVR
ncbi:MAG: hypothetical protein JOZ39_11100 [Chloroflexi bacterium]|nr:hypothetical protein [Chloroflexota bacterium]